MKYPRGPIASVVVCALAALVFACMVYMGLAVLTYVLGMDSPR